ncbi:MAG: hypothetical protein RLZZ474_1541 [Bacteroidota bacterium]|jgi:uncharacterized protein YcfL
MKNITILSLALFFVASSCSKEEVEPNDDNELITTVKLSFKSPTGIIKSFYWRDKQGDGVMDSVDPILLDKNSTYEMSIALLDETKNPVFDISEEIKEEADVHLFIYKATPSGLMSVQIKDLDKNGIPIGLLADIRSQYVAGNGNFQVILKHQPPVNGKAVKTGAEEGGSTDVDVRFPITIQ